MTDYLLSEEFILKRFNFNASSNRLLIIDVFERPNQSKVLPNGTMAKTSRPKLRLVWMIEMSEVFFYHKNCFKNLLHV